MNNNMMKYTQKMVRTLAVTLTLIGLFAGGANAVITITNFQLTTSTVSFDISGELDGPAPAAAMTSIYFVNSIAADPGFVTPVGFEAPVSHTWTGSQTLNGSFPLFTGDSGFSTGDYYGLFFSSALSVGESINGSLSATFAPSTFDPNEVSIIDVVWGSAGSEFSGGSLQTTIAVPEPSSFTLLLLVVVGGFALFRKNKRE